MAKRIERCTCGELPTFTAYQSSEDTVCSQFVCQRGFRLPGGRMTRRGCGKEGPEVEDAFSDRATALWSWNAMIRREAAN